jgi:hypothetical protein
MSSECTVTDKNTDSSDELPSTTVPQPAAAAASAAGAAGGGSDKNTQNIKTRLHPLKHLGPVNTDGQPVSLYTGDLL